MNFVHKKKLKNIKRRDFVSFCENSNCFSCDYIIKINCIAPEKWGKPSTSQEDETIFVQLPTTFNLKLKALRISFCANDFNLCNGSGLWQRVATITMRGMRNERVKLSKGIFCQRIFHFPPRASSKAAEKKLLFLAFHSLYGMEISVRTINWKEVFSFNFLWNADFNQWV